MDGIIAVTVQAHDSILGIAEALMTLPTYAEGRPVFCP